MYADRNTAPVSEKTRAALGLIESLATDPDGVTPADIQVLRDAGCSDDAIEDAIAASAMFHITDRLSDAFDFALPDEAGFAAGAQVLLKRGYQMPPLAFWFSG